jgi:hypothetical protein
MIRGGKEDVERNPAEGNPIMTLFTRIDVPTLTKETDPCPFAPFTAITAAAIPSWVDDPFTPDEEDEDPNAWGPSAEQERAWDAREEWHAGGYPI